MPSAKRRPFCLGLNVLIQWNLNKVTIELCGLKRQAVFQDRADEHHFRQAILSKLPYAFVFGKTSLRQSSQYQFTMDFGKAKTKNTQNVHFYGMCWDVLSCKYGEKINMLERSSNN